MRGITRSLTVLGLAGATALAPATALATTTPHDAEAAAAAGEYVAASLVDGHVPEDAGGGTADAVLALLSTGGDEQLVAQATDWLEQQAPVYAVDGGPAAAKLALVAAATGRDATDFGGVDLIAGIEDALTDEGQCGEFGYAYGQALCALGLHRNDVEVPDEVVEVMLTFQDESGAFGDDASGEFTADPDGSALALTALAVSGHDGATDAAVAVRDWLLGARTEEGYWEGFSPVNTTATVGSALTLVGEDVADPAAWLAGLQLEDGGLPATVDGDRPDLMATSQAAVFLGGESLLSVGEGGTDRVELPATATPGEEDEGAGEDDATGTAEEGDDGAAEDGAAEDQAAEDEAAEGAATPTEPAADETGTDETATEEATEDAEQTTDAAVDAGTGPEEEQGGGNWALWTLLGIAVVAVVGVILALANRGRAQDADELGRREGYGPEGDGYGREPDGYGRGDGGYGPGDGYRPDPGHR